jgi:FKBP-type peptidyl-prolyl cis-trans isomerase
MRFSFPIPALALLAAPCAPAQDAGIPECKDVKRTASGLEYCVLQAGREVPGPGPLDVVVVHYTGWLTNGTRFDSSRDRGEPARFGLNGVIKGWTEGLQLMTPGARHKLIVPPDLGYGAQDRGRIPPNSTLVFDVELIEVIAVPTFRPARKEAQRTTASGLTWEMIKDGTGPKPEPADAVALRFAMFSPEGQLQFCSEQETRPAQRLLRGTGDTMPLPFLKELCGLLRVGDVVRIEVPGSLMGDRPLGRLPPGSASVWEVEMVEILQAPRFTPSDPKKLVRTDSGLQYEVIQAGAGRRPLATDRVRVHYTGWLPDGAMFDSSVVRGEPAEFGLNGVIRGWTEGLQLMQEGAIYQFVIPSELAYGARGSPPQIGPNQTLVFRVELLKVL